MEVKFFALISLLCTCRGAEVVDLSDGAFLVNINSRIHGDTSESTRLTKHVEAGVYSIKVVTPSLHSGAEFVAWNAWGGSTPAWTTGFYINGGEFFFRNNIRWFDTPSLAAQSDPNRWDIYVSESQSLRFRVLDNNLGDNQGGVSLLIEPLVEPKVEIQKVGSNIEVTFSGLLQSSTDLRSFTTIEPQPTSPWVFPSEKQQFFRAIIP